MSLAVPWLLRRPPAVEAFDEGSGRLAFVSGATALFARLTARGFCDEAQASNIATISSVTGSTITT